MIEITLKNAHALADMVCRDSDGPIDALHIAIDKIAEDARMSCAKFCTDNPFVNGADLGQYLKRSDYDVFYSTSHRADA